MATPGVDSECQSTVDTVFYSWQSDLPNSTNRSFIQSALESAAKLIRNDESVLIDPVVDRDTLGETGSPDISSTILRKIDEAQVVVCDVSIVNSGAESPSRLSPNPNVLVELGYAIKALGQPRIIMVMNTHFGTPEQLPFDLKLKRVLKYSTAPGATDRARDRKQLVELLQSNLRAIFDHPRRSPSTDDDHDRKLFRQFLQELPTTGSIQFIRNANMAGFRFRSDSLDQLRSFCYVWNDADHEFVDKKLEAQRRNLLELVDKYLTEIGQNTFVAEQLGYSTVPPEWEHEQPERFFQAVNLLHDLAGSIVDVHQDLVRQGRERLGVSTLK